MKKRNRVLLLFLTFLIFICFSGCAPQKGTETIESSAPEALPEQISTHEPTETLSPPPNTTEPPPAPVQIPEPTVTPVPEPETPVVLTCSLSIRCDDIVSNLEKLVEAKRDIVPADGIILETITAEFSEGESVFDVLKRELRNRKIHLEFVNTPMYNSVYIEGIANLYEFDCGDTSGWMYRVNGVKPTYGCSQYKLQNGDRVEFFYQCKLY